jgi:hypothetical protein
MWRLARPAAIVGRETCDRAAAGTQRRRRSCGCLCPRSAARALAGWLLLWCLQHPGIWLAPGASSSAVERSRAVRAFRAEQGRTRRRSDDRPPTKARLAPWRVSCDAGAPRGGDDVIAGHQEGASHQASQRECHRWESGTSSAWGPDARSAGIDGTSGSRRTYLAKLPSSEHSAFSITKPIRWIIGSRSQLNIGMLVADVLFEFSPAPTVIGGCAAGGAPSFGALLRPRSGRSCRRRPRDGARHPGLRIWRIRGSAMAFQKSGR